MVTCYRSKRVDQGPYLQQYQSYRKVQQQSYRIHRVLQCLLMIKICNRFNRIYIHHDFWSHEYFKPSVYYDRLTWSLWKQIRIKQDIYPNLAIALSFMLYYQIELGLPIRLQSKSQYKLFFMMLNDIFLNSIFL